MTALADSIRKGVPAISVADVAASLDWYVSIGFTEVDRFDDDGCVDWGMVRFGNAELGLVPGSAGPRSGNGLPRPSASGARDASLWFYTDAIEPVHQFFKSKPVEFVEELYDPFYGGRQFSVRDPDGYVLIFLQPA
jgi:catechol 2,3-dioxygenase-like lactoylglutathione lyase family enzyme